MYCKNCGTQLTDQGTCTQCGTSQSMQEQTANTENGHWLWLWGVLGFIFPTVGLVLFIVWKDLKPKIAKYAGIGALIYVIIKCILLLFAGGMIGLYFNNMWY